MSPTQTASARWKTVDTFSPNDLIEALSPDSKWFNGRPQDWIYRGQENADWTLSPSAFRKNELLYHPMRAAEPFENWTNATQTEAELHALRRFFEMADATGLRLPEDSQGLRLTIRNTRDHWLRKETESITWPPRELWSLLALVQHHQVPTRLLDWTRHSLIAAYFAARPGVERPRYSHMAIWAYNTFPHALADLTAKMTNTPNPVEIITAPYADNPNLHAQRGLHMLLNEKPWVVTSAPAERYDLADRLATLGAPLAGTFPLLKFTLPHACAPALLQKLAVREVNAAMLFPGFPGVVASMREDDLVTRRLRLAASNDSPE